MTATTAAIITTSVLAHALPNQVFAQSGMQIFVRNGMGLGQTVAGHEAHPAVTLPIESFDGILHAIKIDHK